MKLTPKQLLQQAVAAQEKGRLLKAEQLYREILKTDSSNPHAIHNLGLLAAHKGNFDDAFSLFKTAVEIKPTIEQFWVSYVKILVQKKQFNDAKQTIKDAKAYNFAGNGLSALEAKLDLVWEKMFTEAKSPSNQQISSLLELFENARYHDAESTARYIIQEYPDHPIGWKVLAGVLKQAGRYHEALQPNKKAVFLSPNDHEASNNLGLTLHSLGRLAEAEASYIRAIQIKFDFPMAHNNLGVTLAALGNVEGAEASYRHALTLNPKCRMTHNNLGNLLKTLGRFEESCCHYSKAIDTDGGVNIAEQFFNLAILQDYTGDAHGAIQSLEKLIPLDPANFGLRARVHLAIHKFLQGDFKGSERDLFQASSINEKHEKSFRNEQIYRRHLLKILSYYREQYASEIYKKATKFIYVIGESHCLVSNHLRVERASDVFTGKSLLVMGCKQWHLGNSEPNQYKHKFKKALHSLPQRSEVLLTFGEIDCRLNEGILKHKTNYPENNLAELIEITVENYLRYVVTMNVYRNHCITIQGVPCPVISVLNNSEREITELAQLIKEVNFEMKHRSRAKGFRFLDVHELTDRGDGISNFTWHVDQYHLSAEGQREAWRKYVSY